MRPRLIVVAGAAIGAEVPLKSPSAFIGRHEPIDICFDDHLISRKHCVIRCTGDGYDVEDLVSKNGTYINGRLIASRTKLLHGDRIRLGSTHLLFLVGPQSDEDFEEPPVYFSDATPDCQYTVREPGALVGKLLHFSTVLKEMQDVLSTRQSIISAVFSLTRADRVALLLTDRMGSDFTFNFGKDRRQPDNPVEVNRGIVDATLKGGRPTLIPGKSLSETKQEATVAWASPTTHCVAFETFGGRRGVIYTESPPAEEQEEWSDLDLLGIIALFAASALRQAAYRERLHLVETPHRLVGKSHAIEKLSGLIATAATSKTTVLIEGESGTGKELVARAIHESSDRADGPFIAINCAAFPDTLVESELFGHERGAFTGAAAQKKGKFEAANGGTIFLDEVGELTPSTQAKLLRVLQEREIVRLGGIRSIPVDIRVVAATNRDLQKEVSEGRFRQDLYFRLKVLPLETPALRDRREDIPLLVEHFLMKYAKEIKPHVRDISPAALKILSEYDWPGNVRELQNVIERAVTLALTETILPEDLLSDQFESCDSLPKSGASLKATKRQHVQNVLQQTNGNIKEAAAILDIHPNYLYRLARKYGITLVADER